MTLLEHILAWWDERNAEVDMGAPVIEVFKRGDGFGFHLRGGNGEIQAGGEGYTRRADAHRGARAAKQNWARAPIVDSDVKPKR